MTDIKISLKKKNKNRSNIIVNVTKISQKMKSKSLLSIEEKIIEGVKTLYYNDKKSLFKK